MKINIKYPEPFRHDHPPVVDVNKILEEQTTLSQRMADRFARLVGSWKFIIIQTIVLGVWIVLNLVAYVNHWDPYPFILMNLVLSMQAAYSAPILMMSQNRQAERDRIEAHNDFLINQKAEVEIRTILEHLEAQNEALKIIHKNLEEKNGSGTIVN